MEGKDRAKTKEEIISPLSVKLTHPWRTFLLEAILFSATIALGVASGLKLMEFRKLYKIPPAQPVSFFHFITAFLFATLLMILIPLIFQKRRAKAAIFKFFFAFTVFFGGILTLGLWLPEILALILMGLLILTWLKKPLPLLHNLCLILAMAGLGTVLGLNLTPLMVVSFLVLFSIYDFIAVYKTKHMIKMAKEMMTVGVILGFIAPSKLADLKIPLRKVKMGGKFLILGGGDVVFPLLLVVSLLPQGLFHSLIVAFFALIGLFFSFLIFISQKIRAPIPALPPIALLSLLGYLLTLLI